MKKSITWAKLFLILSKCNTLILFSVITNCVKNYITHDNMLTLINVEAFYDTSALLWERDVHLECFFLGRLLVLLPWQPVLMNLGGVASEGAALCGSGWVCLFGWWVQKSTVLPRNELLHPEVMSFLIEVFIYPSATETHFSFKLRKCFHQDKQSRHRFALTGLCRGKKSHDGVWNPSLSTDVRA